MTDATDKLLAERGQTHGDFTRHAEVTQQLKDVIREHMDDQKKVFSPVQEEAMEMILHKIGRIVAGNPDHKDHWADIAGYARLVEERL